MWGRLARRLEPSGTVCRCSARSIARFGHVKYAVDDRVGVVTLDRPEAANAQSQQVLMDLDEVWSAAERDRQVKVIVQRSTGKHFSAGHDMSGTQPTTVDREIPIPDALYLWETRHYFHYAKRWRDVPKPSIAAVQGRCIAAGLMLCWPCDLIVAAEDAEFSDPALHMGICGVEFHAHTWEFGARKAKEILFTGSSSRRPDGMAWSTRSCRPTTCCRRRFDWPTVSRAGTAGPCAWPSG